MSIPPGAARFPPPKSTVPTTCPVTKTSLDAFEVTDNPASKEPAPKRLLHWCAPAALYFARNMSCCPALTRLPPPKFTVPAKYPVTSTPLDASAATESATSPAVPPKRWLHWCTPAPSYRATNTSFWPALTRGVPPKFAVLANSPVITTLPDGSTSPPKQRSRPVPPKRWLHWWTPAALYLATKTSILPALTRFAPPKFVVPAKKPVRKTLFAASTPTAVPSSSRLLPKRWLHWWTPAELYLATNASVPPGLTRLTPPKLTVPM